MHRREFLTLAPSFVLGSVGVTLVPAVAQDGAPSLFTAVQRYSLGDWTVVAMSDGYLPFSTDLLIGIEKAEAEDLLKKGYFDPSNILGAVNAYLVDTGETLILIDTGTGSAFGPTLGHLAANLTAAGYDPSRVSQVIATHLHPDHIGGVLLSGGNPFPNASLSVSAADRDFFFNSDIRAGAPDDFKPFFDMAMSAVGAFGERVTFFEGEASVAPGITAQPLPGHTPGHVGFMLETGGETMLVWGDVLHMPAVQFARPDVSLVYDTDPEQAAATRAATLDRVAADRQLVAGMHLLFPGFGYVETASTGYRFVAAPWEYF